MSTTPIETNELEQQSSNLVVQANSFALIESQDQRDKACILSAALRAMRKGLLEWWEQPVKESYRHWKTLVARRDGMINPVEAALRKVDDEIVSYDERQEALRRKQEQEASELLRKQLDEAALEEAERLHDAGDNLAAESVLTQQQHAPAPVVIVPSTVQKVQGESMRSIWRFRIKDVNAIPREYLIPDEVKIGGVVRALKGQSRISGVEVYEEKVRSQRTSSYQL